MKSRITGLALLLVSLMVGLAVGVKAEGPVNSAVESTSAAAAGWHTTCLDCPHYFTEMSGRAAVLDSQEFAHIAYGGRQLYYAREDTSGNWDITVVDPTLGSGRQATIALDAQQQPHILYQAANDGGLNHAWFDGADWHINYLINGCNPWIVSAADGTLRATWLSFGSLFYGIYDGLSWQMAIVAPAQGYPSLALDSQQRPHIAYIHSDIIHHTTFDGATWQTTPFDDGLYSDFPAIALTPNGDVHIVHGEDSIYNQGYGMPIVHRRRSGSQWQTEVPGFGPYYIVHQYLEYSLVAGSNGHLYLGLSVYRQSDTPYPWYDFSELQYAEWDGTEWSHWPWQAGSLTKSTYASLVLNSQNEALIAFKSGSDLALRDPQVSTTVIDRGGIPAGETTLERDNFGTYHALFRETENSNFRYVTAPAVTGPWTLRKSGTASSAGYGSTQLALEVGLSAVPGQPSVHIAHDGFSRGFNSTSYTFFNGQTWDGGDFFGGGGRYAVAVDRQGSGYLAVQTVDYFPSDTVSLEYGRCYGQGICYSQLVDVPVATGHLSVLINTQDLARIAYPGPNGLRYAQQTAAGWLTETVMAGTPDYISLALGADGRPHIAWYEQDLNALKYTFHDGTGWQETTVDNTGDVGQYASLALDSDGRPHIAYYDATNADLKYAYREGGQWYIETVVQDGDVGSHCSLLLLGHNHPHIAYLDRDNYAINLVYKPFEPTEAVYLPLAQLESGS